MTEREKPKTVKHSDGWTTVGINIQQYTESELRQALAKVKLEETKDDSREKTSR